MSEKKKPETDAAPDPQTGHGDRIEKGILVPLANRTRTSRGLTEAMNKVFPRHYSFLWGEIALYSFIMLVLTGTYLALFFHPSQATVVYNGSYAPLQGQEVSDAYASVLNISFDVRAGLLIRQMHHWSALVFVAAIVLHLGRIFFTGAFRKPRELNWVIGCTLLVLAMALGFTGYSLPDDLLSGAGLKIADSVMLSIPFVGEMLSSLVFGGGWPSSIIVSRLFPIHVFVLPLLVTMVLFLHLAMVWRQKHTQFPGPGRTEDNVVGERVWPDFALKSIGLMFSVAAVLAGLGGLAQINPVWLYGPYEVANASSDAQPDWYVGFLEGALRLMPPWEFRGFGRTIPNVFFPGVLLPVVMFGLLFSVPWLERRLTGDAKAHNLLDRPRDAPGRTATGVAVGAFVLVLFLAGSQDIIANTLSSSIETTRAVLQISVFVIPTVAWFLSRSIAKALASGESTTDSTTVRMSLTRSESGGYEPTDEEGEEDFHRQSGPLITGRGRGS